MVARDKETMMPIKFHREVTPEQPRIIYTLIECDNGEIMLSAREVVLLRKMLSTWRENELLPGTQYTMFVELENGDIVSEWQPEHDG